MYYKYIDFNMCSSVTNKLLSVLHGDCCYFLLSILIIACCPAGSFVQRRFHWATFWLTSSWNGSVEQWQQLSPMRRWIHTQENIIVSKLFRVFFKYCQVEIRKYFLWKKVSQFIIFRIRRWANSYDFSWSKNTSYCNHFLS